MPWPDEAQAPKIAQSNSAATLSITFDSALTEGNLLVFCAGTGAANVSTTYAGASEALDINNTTEADRLKIFFKVLGASESTTVTITPSATDEAALWAVELEGPWESAPLDLAEAEARQASGTSYTLAPAGSTSQDDEVAVGFMYTRSQSNVAAWSDSFIEKMDIFTSNKSWHVATKTLTTSAAVTVDVTYGTSVAAMGGLVTFKQEVTGGPAGNPHYYYQNQQLVR